jgi:hypothetical protein
LIVETEVGVGEAVVFPVVLGDLEGVALAIAVALALAIAVIDGLGMATGLDETFVLGVAGVFALGVAVEAVAVETDGEAVGAGNAVKVVPIVIEAPAAKTKVKRNNEGLFTSKV